MQIEIENIFGDAWIIGPECTEEELISKLISVYISVHPKEFANVFCYKYSFKIIPLKERYPSPEWWRVCSETDYRFDLDVGLIFRHEKSTHSYITIYSADEHYPDIVTQKEEYISNYIDDVIKSASSKASKAKRTKP